MALTDFLCWFPVGIMGMMAELGVDIPPEVLISTFFNLNETTSCIPILLGQNFKKL